MNLLELDAALRKLRLSGMADVLEARLRQAQSERQTPIDLVSALVGDELVRRQDRLITRRIQQARFRDIDRSLDTFDLDFNKKMNRALIHELATGRFILQREDVLLLGPPGTGKSHLAQALGHAAARQGFDVLFTTQAQLTGALNAARAIGTFERKLQQLARIDLLIIDDLGLKPLRAPHDEDLHELIGERYERASTIITSNLDIDEWPDVFPGNRVIGLATIDRLRHGAYRIVLDGDSYRTPRDPEKHPKSAVAKHPRNPAS